MVSYDDVDDCFGLLLTWHQLLTGNQYFVADINITKILGYLQLTDFGMARKLQSKEDLVFTFCGTPEYLSPEMLMHKG